jgi:hypothetical protein
MEQSQKGECEEAFLFRSQLGIIARIGTVSLVRKRHQNKHLDFDLVLLRKCLLFLPHFSGAPEKREASAPKASGCFMGGALGFGEEP